MLSHRAEIACFLFFAQCGALFLFSAGFFLTRFEIPQISSCDPSSILDAINASDLWQRPATGCWSRSSYDRVVIVVIDALRIDMIVAKESEEQMHNRLPVIDELLYKWPARSFRAAFEADPPTVTAQRLKGLTTGGLPTFFELRNNFDSPAVTEDSWVHQAGAHFQQSTGSTKTGLSFLGDDTWESLFPGRFRPSLPMASFNTRDLHTVDDAVLNNLTYALHDSDTRVLVAHFLGVDHCGHTFGPKHQEMGSKLDQMDSMLRSTLAEVQKADASTLFILFGDHGMTDDGAHGGASMEETHAGLFVFDVGPLPLETKDAAQGRSWDDLRGWQGSVPNAEADVGSKTARNFFWDGRKVAQVDLVPSLSLLLGLPIPFSNLGGVIPELFNFASSNARHNDHSLVQALLVNSAQVWNYMHNYDLVAGLPSAELSTVRQLLDSAVESHRLLLLDENSRAERCSAEATSIAYRTFLSESLELGRRVFTRFDASLMASGLVGTALSLILLVLRCFDLAVSNDEIASLQLTRTFRVCTLLGLSISAMVHLLMPLIFGASIALTAVATATLVPLLACVVALGAHLSNLLNIVSWHVNWCLLLPILLSTLHCFSRFSNSFIESEGAVLSFLSVSALIYFARSNMHALNEMARLDAAFRRLMLASLLTLVVIRASVEGSLLYKGKSFDAALWSPAVTVAPLFIIALCDLIAQAYVLSFRMTTALMAIFSWALVFLHWFIEWAKATDNLGIAPISFLRLVSDPLQQIPRAVYMVCLVRAVYVHKYSVRDECNLLLLASIVMSFMPSWTLLLGPAGHLSALGMFTLVLALGYCARVAAGSVKITAGSRPLAICASVATWRLIGRHLYFASGHSNKFSDLQYSSAYVGFNEFYFPRAAILLAVNTFGTEVLWCLVCLPIGLSLLRRHQGVKSWSKEQELCLTAVAAFQTADFTCSMLCAAVHRRHLMVWAIFAPKFIVDAAVYLVVLVCLLCLRLCTEPSNPTRAERRD